jgi:hypothetical protein
MQLDKVRRFHAIDGCHIGAAALRLEAEPAVPCADIQHALAAQIAGDGEAREALPQARSGFTPSIKVPSGSSKL